MKARIATALAILALSTVALSPATAQQPQALPTLDAAETTISAAAAATLPALDSPTVTTTAAPETEPQQPEPQPITEPQPTTAEPQPEPATLPTITVDPTPITVDPTPTAVDPYSGNPIVDCEAQGLITAEDATCVSSSFYAPEPVCQEDEPCWNCETMGNKVCGAGIGETVDDFLSRVCDGPKLGDAYAGIMRNCYYQEARTLAPNSAYMGSGSTADPAATYWIPSQRYDGIIHSFRD